jgi:thioredoxin-like negative regulator of GroEL
MEKLPKREEQETLSLVEQKRVEALTQVLDQLDSCPPVEMKRTFFSNEREYALTSPADCMVAFAQQNREAVEALYKEILGKNDYRAEQATVKILELFEAYEKTVSHYAELLSYYPVAAARVTAKLPPLSEITAHGKRVWDDIK